MLYTVKEVAGILKTNQDFVHRLRRSGKLKFMKLGAYKVRAQELERFLEECEGWDMTDPEHPRELA